MTERLARTQWHFASRLSATPFFCREDLQYEVAFVSVFSQRERGKESMDFSCCLPSSVKLPFRGDRRVDTVVPVNARSAAAVAVRDHTALLAEPVVDHSDKNVHDDHIDTILSSALGDLSIQERENVYSEVHGINEAIEETPEMLARQLNDFAHQLSTQVSREPHKKTHAYQMALVRSPSYVGDPKFRLAFLRAERFEADKAAARYLRFFEAKLFLFGEEKLCKDIALADLSAEDMKSLRAGFFQLLPQRDRAGRVVGLILPNFQTYKHHTNFVSQQQICWQAPSFPLLDC